MNYKQYFALSKKLGWGEQEKCQIVAQYSNGATESLSELAEKHPLAYREMLAKMRELASNTPSPSDADMWRKRVIAAVASWLDATGNKPANRMAYIKAVACRTVDKQASQFNIMTIPQLRTVYNSFVKQREALKNANELTKIMNTNKN